MHVCMCLCEDAIYAVSTESVSCGCTLYKVARAICNFRDYTHAIANML